MLRETYFRYAFSVKDVKAFDNNFTLYFRCNLNKMKIRFNAKRATNPTDLNV